MKTVGLLFKLIIIASSLTSCYIPRIASYANLQDTLGLPSSQVTTITTISDHLSLSDFQNITENDIKKTNLAYSLRNKTRLVTLKPGVQTFAVSYDDIKHHKKITITIDTEAATTYTVNYERDYNVVNIWVINNKTNLSITGLIPM